MAMSSDMQLRQEREKQVIVEQLAKTPIVQLACEKAGMSRATYYRWRRDDPGFARDVDEAMWQGVALMNDYAESQLLAAIREGVMPAITFWLKTRHPAYRPRLDVAATVTPGPRQLTPVQSARLESALQLAGLLTSPVEKVAKMIETPDNPADDE